MQKLVKLAVLLAVSSLMSCASVNTYTDPTLKTKTGILYYPPKPYLLVARTGAKDKPNDVQVIYLPDLSKPRYVVMRGGYGSSKLGLTFSNGVLVSANQESDPKITEAITALAGIPGALANAAKTRAETSNLREEAGDMPKAAAMARTVAADLTAIAADPAASTSLTPTQLTTLMRLPKLLTDSATVLEAPGSDDKSAEAALALLKQVKQQLSAIKPAGEPSDSAREFWNRLRTAEGNLDKAVAELKQKEKEQPTLSLYEVVINDDGTALREVPLSTISEAAPVGTR